MSDRDMAWAIWKFIFPVSVAMITFPWSVSVK